MKNIRTMTRSKGFTLIEILIVVIILGILAAIVIPQFSSASGDARKSSLATTVQSLKSQVALYRLQHNDSLPGVASFWTLMTTKTDAAGAAYTASSSSGPFGPYMQDIPKNALNSNTSVLDSAIAPGSKTASACGYQYDFTGGTGKVWGTDTDGLTVLP